MKVIKYNNNELTDEEIEKTVNKVRAVVINDKGQCLLARYAGIYMLPGGKIDQGETEEQAIEREILEETGISIDSSKATKFFEMKSYDRDYYDRVEQKKINRLTNTIFYEVHTNDEVNESKKKLTQSEKQNNYQVGFVNISKIIYLVETNVTNNPKKSNFDREILTALRQYREFKMQEEKERDGDR